MLLTFVLTLICLFFFACGWSAITQKQSPIKARLIVTGGFWIVAVAIAFAVRYI